MRGRYPKLRCCCFSSFLVCKHYPFQAGIASVLPKFVCTACYLFLLCYNTLLCVGGGAQRPALISVIWKQHHECTNVYWCQAEGRLSLPELHLKASQVPRGRKKQITVKILLALSEIPDPQNSVCRRAELLMSKEAEQPTNTSAWPLASRRHSSVLSAMPPG